MRIEGARGRHDWDDIWKTWSGQLPCVTTPKEIASLHRLLRRSLPRGRTCRTLEIGAAPGRFLAYFAREFGHEVAGVEYSSAGCELTRQNLKMAGVDGMVICGDFFSHEIPPASYDVVASFGFIEHFKDRTAVLKCEDELLKPGGWIITAWPNLRGLPGWVFRHARPQAYAQHYVFPAQEIADFLRELGYSIAFAGPIGGPKINAPLHPGMSVVAKHPFLSRLVNAPFHILNGACDGVNHRLGWIPESRLLSCSLAVVARKP